MISRRHFLLGTASLAFATAGLKAVKYWPKPGMSNPCLNGIPTTLQRHPLMQQVWAGIDANQVWDSHVHLVGMGGALYHSDALSIYVNPQMDSWIHPILKLQKHFYVNGVCAGENPTDNSIVERMTNLVAEMPKGFKTLLFAFDWYHDENGQIDADKSIFYISNEYAASVASDHSQYFEWAASIHPYRVDALDALDVVNAKGARAIKWLPSGMGIDPASTKCYAFYKKCQALNLPIISHTGRESAVQGGNQAFGNPLKMRPALDAGVCVVLAHCASDGHDEDLDNGNKTVKSFELFTRLMDAPQYQNLLMGDISALTIFNHVAAIKPLLERTDWHSRLLNGSDYPLPGIMALISLQRLVEIGLLNATQVGFLNELRTYNALMFDIAVKRLLSFKGNSFSAQVFETRRFFDDSFNKNKKL